MNFHDVDASGPAAAIAFLDMAERVSGQEKSRYVDLLDVQPCSLVLDVGCGTGIESAKLAQLAGSGGQVIGIDKSRRLLEEARARHAADNLTFVEADIYDLPFDDDHFDRCHIQRVLHCLECPARALREIIRVTRGGGVIMANEPDWHSLSVDGGDAILSSRILAGLGGQPDGPTNMGRWLGGLFSECGLAIAHDETTGLLLRDFDTSAAMFNLTGWAAEAIADGHVDRDGARTWLRSLIEASRAGEFACSVAGRTVVGRKTSRVD